MTSLTFYTNPMSRGRIIRWMLEELGEPYETVVLDYDGGMKTPEFLAINPMGKVPTIVHGDAVVTEAAAICAYLADAYPGKKLAPPPGDPARAAYYRWLFFAAGPVEAAVTNKSQGFESDKSQMLGYGSFDATMDALEHAVTRSPYITGSSFSAADVYVGSQIMWGLMFGTMPKRLTFEDYTGRLAARPAHVRADELDNALMPKEQASHDQRHSSARDPALRSLHP